MLPLALASDADTQLALSIEIARHIEWYEGPLVSEGRSADGRVWLIKWASCDDTANRWVLHPTTADAIAEYLAGKRDLRSLETASPPPCLVMDIDSDGGRIVRTIGAEITSYLAQEGCMYDPDLSPDAG